MDGQDLHKGAVRQVHPVRGVLEYSYQHVLDNRILLALVVHVHADNHQDHHTLTTVAVPLARGYSHDVADGERDEEEDGAAVPVPKVAGTHFREGLLHTVVDRTDEVDSQLPLHQSEAHWLERLQTVAPIQQPW